MNRLELEETAKRIEAAKCPEDAFGDVSPDDLNATYKHLAAAVHPDKYTDPEAKPVATDAFTRLNQLKGEADRKIAAGTYGKRDVAAPAPPGPFAIKVGAKLVEVGDALCRGDLADLYRCTIDGTPALLKLAQRSRENDLLENEAVTLKKIYPANAEEKGHLRYLPRLVESFALKGSKSTRRANVLESYPEHRSLAEIRAVHANGLDFRDVAWMLRRMLEGIGYVHTQGYVHGAILPPHVLLHPVNHGARIVDWCYAVPTGGKVKAISVAHRDWYPLEVIEKRAATSATDIYMIARCAQELLKGQPVPGRLSAFLRGCMLEAQNRRPQDAWALHEELGGVLLGLVGKPKYRELPMPTKAENAPPA